MTKPTQDTGEPGQHADRLETEIDGIRDHLDGLVTELDQRRHGLNPRIVLARHPWAVAIGGAALIGLVIGGVAWRNARAQKRNSLRDSFKGRAQRWRTALSGAREEQPETTAQGSPGIGMKILTAAGTAAAAVVARRLVTRLLAPPS